jgi:hypothetical protein
MAWVAQHGMGGTGAQHGTGGSQGHSSMLRDRQMHSRWGSCNPVPFISSVTVTEIAQIWQCLHHSCQYGYIHNLHPVQIASTCSSKSQCSAEFNHTARGTTSAQCPIMVSSVTVPVIMLSCYHVVASDCSLLSSYPHHQHLFLMLLHSTAGCAAHLCI